MDLTLYKVGSSGRVALGDLTKGVEFYTVEEKSDGQNGGGVLILTPVRVVAATGTKTTAPVVEPSETEPATDDTPWDQ